MKTVYIIKGQGLNYKRQMSTQFVNAIVDGGCGVTYCEAEAKQFDTEAEALAIINGRHACGTFVVVAVEVAADTLSEAERLELDLLHEDAHYNGGYDASQDIDSKWNGVNPSASLPFNLMYDAALNQIQYLIKNGKGKEAAALRVKLTELNIQHNSTPANGGAVYAINSPAAIAA